MPSQAQSILDSRQLFSPSQNHSPHLASVVVTPRPKNKSCKSCCFFRPAGDTALTIRDFQEIFVRPPTGSGSSMLIDRPSEKPTSRARPMLRSKPVARKTSIAVRSAPSSTLPGQFLRNSINHHLSNKDGFRHGYWRRCCRRGFPRMSIFRCPLFDMSMLTGAFS